MLLGTQRINEKNHLEIGGCDAVELAREFGTPLYVMDEETVRANCRAYKAAFEREYGSSAVAYAGKAFLVTAMCVLADQEGMWLDVASAGELHTAKIAGFPMDRVLLHGPFKSPEELGMAVEAGVKYVVVDSLPELALLEEIAAQAGRTQNILIRCNPGVDPHTHRLIRTGQEDSKFGFNIKSGAAMEAAKLALASRHLALRGIHCHVGSQLLEVTPFVEAAPVMVGFISQLLDETGTRLGALDMGGGLGVRYIPEHEPPTIDEFARALSRGLIVEDSRDRIERPMLLVEPGRSIVGEAGTTLYTVGPVKTVPIPEDPGIRNYLLVDGGLSDNPRPALYDAVYSALLANRAAEEPTATYTVAGKHCETDMLIADLRLPEARTGDLLAVQTTGAYNHAMSSNYNRFTRPAVVFVRDGHADLVYRREIVDDLIKCDIMPDRLRNL